MNFADLLAAPGPARAQSDDRKRQRAAAIAIGLGALLLVLLAGATTFAGQGLRVAGGLAVVAGIAFGALRLLSNAHRAPASPLRLVARTPLSPRTAVALIELENERFLVAYGDGFTQLLATRPATPRQEGSAQ